MMRRAVRRTAAIASITLVLAGVMVAGTAQVSAHTSLLASDPPDGAILAAPPDAVTFTFDEPLLPGTSTLAINRADGSLAAAAEVEPSGATVAIDWPVGLGTGSYQIAYRVVSADGHPVSGAIWIEVAEPDAAGTDSASTDAGESTMPSPSSPDSPLTTVGTAESAAWGPAALLASAASLLALGIATVIFVRRRRSE